MEGHCFDSPGKLGKSVRGKWRVALFPPSAATFVMHLSEACTSQLIRSMKKEILALCCRHINALLFLGQLWITEVSASFTCGTQHFQLIEKATQYGTQMFIWRVICCWCCINTSVLVNWPNSDLWSPGNSRKLWWICNYRGTFLAAHSLLAIVLWCLETAVVLWSKWISSEML